MDQPGTEEKKVPDAFITQLTNAQRELALYIRTLMGGDAAAQDVLQETNLYIWKNAAEFPKIENFLAWAKRMALMQVRKYRLYRQREGVQLVFDEPLFESVAGQLAAEEPSDSLQVEMFKHCLGRLKAEDRELLNEKYLDRVPSAKLARRLDSTENAVNFKLFKIRAALDECMRKAACRLNAGGEL